MSDLCGVCPVTWLLQLTHTSDHWLCWRYFQELSSFSTIKVIITACHDILDWTIHHYVKFSTESVSQSSNYWLIRQFHKIFSVNLLAMNCKGRLYLLEGGGGNQINEYIFEPRSSPSSSCNNKRNHTLCFAITQKSYCHIGIISYCNTFEFDIHLKSFNQNTSRMKFYDIFSKKNCLQLICFVQLITSKTFNGILFELKTKPVVAGAFLCNKQYNEWSGQ